METIYAHPWLTSIWIGFPCIAFMIGCFYLGGGEDSDDDG